MRWWTTFASPQKLKPSHHMTAILVRRTWASYGFISGATLTSTIRLFQRVRLSYTISYVLFGKGVAYISCLTAIIRWRKGLCEFVKKREDIELTQAGEEEEVANAGKWGREETFGGESQGWQLQVTNIIITRCNFLGLEIHILCSFGSSLRYNAALFGTSLHNHSADDTVSKPSLY